MKIRLLLSVFLVASLWKAVAPSFITLNGLPTNSSNFSVQDRSFKLAMSAGNNMFPLMVPLSVKPEIGQSIDPINNATCTFDNSFCGWKHKSGWSLAAKQIQAGIKKKCAYFDKKSASSTTSDLYSPVIDKSEQGYCFHFDLYLRIKHASSNKLFFGVMEGVTADGKTVSGDLGKKWNHLDMHIQSDSPFRLVFQVDHPADHSFGELMLGDFQLTSGKCPETK